MKELGSPPLTSYSLADPRWELAQRVADGSNFRNCPKLRGFLLYVCENALLGRLENVREHLIGTRVFGRHLDYNLNEDNIVRVEARELRKRLASYFADEGRNEPVVIEIPKGGYVPVFKQREPPIAEAVEIKVEAPTVLPEPKGRTTHWRIPFVAGALAILTAAVIWLAVANWQLRQRPHYLTGTRSNFSAEDFSFYVELLGTLGSTPNRQTLLVLSNPKVVLYYGSASNQPISSLPGHTIPAPRELKSSFDDALNNLDRDLPFKFLHSTREDYTGMGEAISAFHVGRLMQFLQRPVRLTQGRFLSWDHVQKGDLILLGGPQINDWTYQNAARSNFNFDGTGAIENLNPLPNEQKRYLPHSNTGATAGAAVTDYGLIKMVTSPYAFNMLLLAGGTSAGTAGVGEFFASPERMKVMYNRIRASAPGKPFPSDWEILIQINVRDGIPVETSALACRPNPASH
jgi:hypothetical protein